MVLSGTAARGVTIASRTLKGDNRYPGSGGQVIVRPLFRKILRDIGISVDDCSKTLEKL